MSLEKRIFACFIITLLYFCLTNTANSDTEDNPYDVIVKRNAFSLTSDLPILPPITNLVQVQPIKVHLTGIMKYHNRTNVYLFSKDLPKKFITLSTNKPGGDHDSGITLLSVMRGQVRIMQNNVVEVLTFDTHKLPTILGPAPKTNGPTIVKKDDRRRISDKKDEKKEIKKSTPRPSIIKVPSRRPEVSPKIIEKGLEYLSRMEEGEKKEALLKRMESLQSGQYQIKSDIDRNERHRQYDEWRKKRDN